MNQSHCLHFSGISLIKYIDYFKLIIDKKKERTEIFLVSFRAMSANRPTRPPDWVLSF